MQMIEKKADETYLPLDYPGYHENFNSLMVVSLFYIAMSIPFSVSSYKFWTFCRLPSAEVQL